MTRGWRRWQLRRAVAAGQGLCLLTTETLFSRPALASCFPTICDDVQAHRLSVQRFGALGLCRERVGDELACMWVVHWVRNKVNLP